MPWAWDLAHRPLRLAVAAYLARYRGQTRRHADSDLRAYLTWCQLRGLNPFAGARSFLRLTITSHRLTVRPDGLFELTDAVSRAGGPVHSLVDLSLRLEHRCGHGGPYGTLSAGHLGTEALQVS